MAGGEVHHSSAEQSELDRTWQKIRRAYVKYDGHVTIGFPDRAYGTREAGQRAYYLGDLSLIGEDKSGKWIEVRLTDHHIYTPEADRARRQLSDELASSLPEAITDWPAEDLSRWANALLLNREIQLIIGNMQELPVSDEIRRFYMEQVGPIATVRQDPRYV